MRRPVLPHSHPPAGRRAGIGAALAGATGNQVGAAFGSLAFPVIGPAGVVAVRQVVVAAAVLLPLVRPRVRDLTRAQWWPVLLLACVFGSMNLSLYLAIERIGLGLAVTLEFCGPLAVAVLSARGRATAVCAVLAAGGVVAISRPQPSTDYLGIALGLVAAASWAAYILLNRTIGTRITGARGTALATSVSALAFLPVGAWILLTSLPGPEVIAYAVLAGVLASAVPFAADMHALRLIPAQLFGILMSSNLVLAAVIGVAALGEPLGRIEAVGIAAIVLANITALGTRSAPGTRGGCRGR